MSYSGKLVAMYNKPYEQLMPHEQTKAVCVGTAEYLRNLSDYKETTFGEIMDTVIFLFSLRGNQFCFIKPHRVEFWHPVWVDPENQFKLTPMTDWKYFAEVIN